MFALAWAHFRALFSPFSLVLSGVATVETDSYLVNVAYPGVNGQCHKQLEVLWQWRHLHSVLTLSLKKSHHVVFWLISSWRCFNWPAHQFNFTVQLIKVAYPRRRRKLLSKCAVSLCWPVLFSSARHSLDRQTDHLWLHLGINLTVVHSANWLWCYFRYLTRTAMHPNLVSDPDFREFLEKDGDLPKSTSTSALSGAGVKRLLNKVGESLDKITLKVEESDEVCIFQSRCGECSCWQGAFI